MCVYFSGVLS